MKHTTRIPQTLSRRVWLAVLLGLCSLSIASLAQAAPTVDQTPLTVQAPVAPNIVLMLDDSGSMNWNFMPDICYVNGVSCDSNLNLTAQPSNNALIDASNNGVYYNPTVTYVPPPTATGPLFPTSPSLTNAYATPFTGSTTAVNLTQYALASSYSAGSNNGGSSPYTYTGSQEYDYTAVYSQGYSNVAFSTSTQGTSATCHSGYTLTNTGTASSPNYVCTASGGPGSGSSGGGNGVVTPTCPSGSTYNSSLATNNCTYPAPTPGCPGNTSLLSVLQGGGLVSVLPNGATLLQLNLFSCIGFPVIPTCLLGSTYNASTNSCVVTPSCP
ncbi:MAG: hypothetical protein ACRETW_10475, partial [Stenotrophobium sp.]